MTYHSTIHWDWNQEVTEEVINEVKTGCIENRRYNENNGGSDLFTPAAYGTFGPLDSFIINACCALDNKNSKEEIQKRCEKAPNPEKAFKILWGAIEKVRIGEGEE